MNARICPFCRLPIPRNDAPMLQSWEGQAMSEGWNRREFQRFDSGTVNAAVASGAVYERSKPIRPARLESDVWVPALQSVISGAVGALVIGCGSALAGAGWRSFLWAGIGGAGCLGLAWAVILGEHRKALVAVERLVGRDLNGDGFVGRPAQAAPREPLRVEVTETNERGHLRRVRYVALPANITDQDLHRVACAVLQDGKPFSKRGLGGVLNPEKYSGVYRPMLRGGMIRYTNGVSAGAGVELTASGRSFLRQYEAV